MNAVKLASENQKRAADPDKSVFVIANAGSGKTKVLVDRIARLLLAGSQPSAFLCITYTKAAAAEMQRRLFERLGGWCVADDAKLGAELAALGAASADLGRARALFAQALETPGGLKIQTIHAFCERLLARFPIEAGVPPGFDIGDEARAAALLGQARAEAALAQDAPLGAFRRFAARMSGDALDALMDRLAMSRAAFHAFAEKHQGPIFAESALRNRHGVRQSLEGAVREFVTRQDWEGLRRACGPLSESGPQDRALGERIQAAISSVDGQAPIERLLKSCFAVAFKNDGAPYKNLLTASVKKDHPWLDLAIGNFADACAALRAEANAIERAEDAVAALALALKLDQAYAEAKAGAGVLDFDDLIEHACALLRRSEAAPWVLYKLDGGLDHILIDESQDTSPGQWDLIAPLQDEFMAGRGARAATRTIFAVGDPKQSIYGFQGADPGRFLGESQKLEKRARRGGFAFDAPDLRTSFRSAPEILRAVDATFAKLPLLDSAPGRHDIIEHLAARADAQGAVEVWPIARRPVAQPAQAWDAPLDVETGVSASAILANAVAQRVKQMIADGEAVGDKEGLRPVRPGDILALVRTRGALFRDLIKALKRAGLPVAGADRMVLREELAVEDCLALMRVALDPADDLSLACVLKGPWCNLDDDDADLLPLAHGRGRGETLRARLMANAEPKYAFARALVAALEARAGADAFAFLSWALETAHEGAQSGWERVFARLGPEARDPLEELLQRALKPAHHTAPTLQRFLHEIDSDAGQVKRELEAESGAVRVMTVHGAKGLEAPVVFLPDTTAGVEGAPDSGLIFDDDNGPFVSFREKDDDDKVAAARAAHKARMESEHWRLLYVAMTRARDRLIVCGAQYGNSSAGEDTQSWRGAVLAGLNRLEAPACETPFGEGVRLGKVVVAPPVHQQEAAAAAAPSWLRAPAPDAAFAQTTAPSRVARLDPALFSPRGDGQRRFRRGKLIHGLLERLPEVAPEAREAAAQAWLERQGAHGEEAERFAAEALAVIGQFPQAFAPNSRAEAPIVGQACGRAVSGIVDRLAVEGRSVFVLDFKTDRPAPADVRDAPPAYVMQLALYCEVLQQIFPGREIQAALLWTEAPRLMPLAKPLLQTALDGLARG